MASSRLCPNVKYFWPVIVTLVPTGPLLGVVVRRLSARPARKKARAVLCITLFCQFRWIARSCHAHGCACAGGARDRHMISVDDGVPFRSRCARAELNGHPLDGGASGGCISIGSGNAIPVLESKVAWVVGRIALPQRHHPSSRCS